MFVRNLLLLLCCLPLTGGEAWSGAAKEREMLEGTWRFIPSKGEYENEKSAAVRVIFKGNRIMFVAEGKPTVQGDYTVDPSRNPKTMDITLDKDGANATTQAIYDLDGDTLKICHYLGIGASKKRPKEFMADKQTVLGFLKREKAVNQTDELMALHRELAKAIVRNDAEAIGRYLADDWTLIGTNGNVTHKSTLLSLIRSGVVSHEVMEFDDVKVRLYGETAVITARATSKGKFKGDVFSELETSTDVYVKQERQWKCVLTHLTRVSKQ